MSVDAAYQTRGLSNELASSLQRAAGPAIDWSENVFFLFAAAQLAWAFYKLFMSGKGASLTETTVLLFQQMFIIMILHTILLNLIPIAQTIHQDGQAMGQFLFGRVANGANSPFVENGISIAGIFERAMYVFKRLGEISLTWEIWNSPTKALFTALSLVIFMSLSTAGLLLLGALGFALVVEMHINTVLAPVFMFVSPLEPFRDTVINFFKRALFTAGHLVAIYLVVAVNILIVDYIVEMLSMVDGVGDGLRVFGISAGFGLITILMTLRSGQYVRDIIYGGASDNTGSMIGTLWAGSKAAGAGFGLLGKAMPSPQSVADGLAVLGEIGKQGMKTAGSSVDEARDAGANPTQQQGRGFMGFLKGLSQGTANAAKSAVQEGTDAVANKAGNVASKIDGPVSSRMRQNEAEAEGRGISTDGQFEGVTAHDDQGRPSEFKAKDASTGSETTYSIPEDMRDGFQELNPQPGSQVSAKGINQSGGDQTPTASQFAVDGQQVDHRGRIRPHLSSVSPLGQTTDTHYNASESGEPLETGEASAAYSAAPAPFQTAAGAEDDVVSTSSTGRFPTVGVRTAEGQSRSLDMNEPIAHPAPPSEVMPQAPAPKKTEKST